jgi:hypothetical protein
MLAPRSSGELSFPIQWGARYGNKNAVANGDDGGLHERCGDLGRAGAQEIPVVIGELWPKSPEPVKKAYLVGIGNAIQIEAAYEGANPPTDGQSIVPRLSRGLKG